MHVDETDRARTSSIPIRIHAGGKARAGQQRHSRKWHVIKGRVVLGVSHQEGSLYSHIAQERGLDLGRVFLEKGDTWGFLFQSLEDMAKDEFGA